MAALFAHETDYRAIARLIAVSVPIGARLLQYCTLFTPPKTRLTAAKKIKLVLQLLPDLERCAVTHRGREWAAPLSAWAQAIDQMLATRDAGRLDLPMKNHVYLYTILMGLADKAEGSAEAQANAERFQAARVQAINQRPAIQDATRLDLPMKGDALQQVQSLPPARPGGRPRPRPGQGRCRCAQRPAHASRRARLHRLSARRHPQPHHPAEPRGEPLMTIPATTIVRQYVTQSPLNLAIINFVAKRDCCGVEELAEIFEDRSIDASRRAFRGRLNYLATVGQLSAAGKGGARLWSLGPAAGIKGVRGAPTRPAKAPRQEPDFGAPNRQAPKPDLQAYYQGIVTPPRQYDVMFGPVYVPPRSVCPRAGALDYKAIARRGHAC